MGVFCSTNENASVPFNTTVGVGVVGGAGDDGDWNRREGGIGLFQVYGLLWFEGGRDGSAMAFGDYSEIETAVVGEIE